MTAEVIAANLSLGISLIMLAILVKLFADLRTDVLRDKLFAVRDEMFLYACEQDLLDHPGYTNLRLIANNLIRYAHRATPLRVLMLKAAHRLFKIEQPVQPVFQKWKEGLDQLPPEQARHIEAYHQRITHVLKNHAVGPSLAPVPASSN